MIKAVITDFDGTLVDTFDANLFAYQEVLGNIGVNLARETYRDSFGLRFDDFMDKIRVLDPHHRKIIRDKKTEVYPKYFDKLLPNRSLIEFLYKLKASSVQIAMASTARKENIINVLDYLKLTDLFDLIVAGVNVKKGKPDPEIYLLSMEILKVSPSDVLIFEDSEVGLSAAKASGANYIKITEAFFK